MPCFFVHSTHTVPGEFGIELDLCIAPGVTFCVINTNTASCLGSRACICMRYTRCTSGSVAGKFGADLTFGFAPGVTFCVINTNTASCLGNRACICMSDVMVVYSD